MDDYVDRKMDVVRDTYFEQNHDFQNKLTQFGSVVQASVYSRWNAQPN